MRRLCLVVVLLLVLTGCEEEESIWANTAPTLAPTVSPLIIPTPVPAYAGMGSNSLIAGSLPANSSLPPVVLNVSDTGLQTVQVSLSTGELAIGYLYPPTEDENADPFAMLRSPGVLLLGEANTAWGILPDALRDLGYVVLILNVTELSIADFHNVFTSLQVTQSVDPGSMAVIGFGEQSDVALLGCAETLGCDALVLFAPSSDEALLFAMTEYSPRPVLIVASSSDPRQKAAAESLFSVAHIPVSELFLWGESDPERLINDFIWETLSSWMMPILEAELNYTPVSPFGVDLMNPDLDAPIDLNIDLDLGLD